ncbi:MAG TPA: penicillin-binding protein 2 [Planctomycetota bacterium]
MDPSSRRRAAVVGAAFAVLFLGLIAHLYAVQILGVYKRGAARAAQNIGHFKVSTPPGTIADPDGQVFALSVPVDSLWVNPSAFSAPERAEAARRLAAVLGLREADLRTKLDSRAQREFVWAGRKLSEEKSKAVRDLLRDPLFKAGAEPKAGFTVEYARRYPHGSLMAHVLGHRGDDPRNLEGLERYCEEWLRGKDTTYASGVDGLRRLLEVPSVNYAVNSVQLTVNLHFQKIVEEEGLVMMGENKPKWASIVALDPKTGAVLAMANWPTFDPNRPADSPAEARLNRAIVLPYEPGSTLKPFTIVSALDLGLLRPDSKIDCENGIWKHGPRLLHDHHPYGKISVADINIHSSNIGAAKIGALILGAKRTHEALTKFGFGVPTGIDLPAEDNGRLFPLKKWNIYSETSVPMGHEIMVTPLQLVAAMSAIANGGTLYRPWVIKRIETSDGHVLSENGPQPVHRVVSERAAREMVEILKLTVKDGTGKKAAVDGVAVAGKTGTSQKIDPVTKHYTHEKYISSFVGFAPADDPKVCLAVIVDEPQGAYYGGAVAAPVVGRILQRGLVHLR